MPGPSKLKRVSPPTEAAITALADREDRTFVAQLDRVVVAGLQALGEPIPDGLRPTPEARPPRRPRRQPVTASS